MKRSSDYHGEDLHLLQMVLNCFDDLSDYEQKAFSGMKHRLESKIKKGIPAELNELQRKWLSDVAKRLDVVEPATNLVSRGLVPRGEEVPTPPILQNLPLKPPGR